MGFPGRLNEKKVLSPVFLMLGGMVVVILGWLIWLVVDTINKPLQQTEEGLAPGKRPPGIIQKKADTFGDDIRQITHGQPLTKAPARKYENGSTIILEGADLKKDYYHDQGGSDTKQKTGDKYPIEAPGSKKL